MALRRCYVAHSTVPLVRSFYPCAVYLCFSRGVHLKRNPVARSAATKPVRFCIVSCRVCGDATESRCTDNHATIYRPPDATIAGRVCDDARVSRTGGSSTDLFLSFALFRVGCRRKKRADTKPTHWGFLSRPRCAYLSLPCRTSVTITGIRLAKSPCAYPRHGTAGSPGIPALSRSTLGREWLLSPARKDRRTCAERFGEGDACIPSPRSGENRRRVTERLFFSSFHDASATVLATRAERFSPKPNPGVTKIEIGGRTGARRGAHVRRRRRSSTHIIRTVFRCCYRAVRVPGSLFAQGITNRPDHVRLARGSAPRIPIDREGRLPRLPFFRAHLQDARHLGYEQEKRSPKCVVTI